jgi:hypothetical protein
MVATGAARHAPIEEPTIRSLSTSSALDELLIDLAQLRRATARRHLFVTIVGGALQRRGAQDRSWSPIRRS